MAISVFISDIERYTHQVLSLLFLVTNNILLHASCAMNDGRDIRKYEYYKSGKIRHTYHGLLINFVSNNACTLEHILSRTWGETHFVMSRARILVGAVFSRELTLWPTCIWRNVAKISRSEGCYKLTLIIKNIMTFALKIYTYMYKKITLYLVSLIYRSIKIVKLIPLFPNSFLKYWIYVKV